MKKDPLIAGWSLTRMCNLQCAHCYSSSGSRACNELSTAECMTVADKLAEAGVVAVNFGGGECSLRTDFIRLCEYLCSLGIKISYTTNGTTFRTIRNHLHLFHDVGVSIDFADAAKHDAFRGGTGVFREAMQTVRELVAGNVDTEIVTCLTRLNASTRELQRLYDLARELGVNYWRLNRFRANGRGARNEKYLALSRMKLKEAYAFLALHAIRDSVMPDPLFRAAFGGNYSVAGDPSGVSAFRIQADGEVTPSVFLSVSGGNILDSSIEEIMDSRVFNEIRHRRARLKCRTCPSYSHCRGGDAGASFLEYGHFDGPDPLCWIEPGEAQKEVGFVQPEAWNVHERYLCTVYLPIAKELKEETEIHGELSCIEDCQNSISM